MATILVVDDEQEISSAIQSILEDEGHQIVLCPDGRAAIDRLASGLTPDLVISDVMMPRLSGFELLTHIRAHRELKRLPVILMSAINPSKTRLEAKWDDFIKKPFNLDALLNAVNRQIG